MPTPHKAPLLVDPFVAGAFGFIRHETLPVKLCPAAGKGCPRSKCGLWQTVQKQPVPEEWKCEPFIEMISDPHSYC